MTLGRDRDKLSVQRGGFGRGSFECVAFVSVRVIFVSDGAAASVRSVVKQIAGFGRPVRREGRSFRHAQFACCISSSDFAVIRAE